MINDPLGGMA